MNSKHKTKKNSFPYRPEDDGVTHINIWLYGNTELGKMLSHFYESPFVHPYYGPFKSLEGFWHFIKNEEHDDTLRSLSGQAAKDYGKILTKCYVDNFKEIIIAANFYKIEQNEKLRKLFIESTLPFTYYYVFIPKQEFKSDENEGVLISNDSFEWLVKGFEENRILMKNGQRPVFNDYKPMEPA